MDNLVENLTEALLDESQRNEILSLTGGNAVLVIDCLDKVSQPSCVPGCRVFTVAQIISSEGIRMKGIHVQSKVFSAILRLSRGSQCFPRSYWIEGSTISLPEEPHTTRTRAEVYMGVWNGEPVAVKVLKTLKFENQTKLKAVGTGNTARGHQLT